MKWYQYKTEIENGVLSILSDEENRHIAISSITRFSRSGKQIFILTETEGLSIYLECGAEALETELVKAMKGL